MLSPDGTDETDASQQPPGQQPPSQEPPSQEPPSQEPLSQPGPGQPASGAGPSVGYGSRRHRRPHRQFAVTFACWWLLFAGLGVVWAVATPIGASPDAPSQVARAASVARGQWLGRAVPGTASAITTYVRVPETYLDPGLMAHCYMFKESVSAACAPSPGHSSKMVRTTTHVGRYPPAYYLAVGWPSLLTTSVAGIYLMQAASVVLGAAFLALAMAIARLWSSSALLVPAVAVAATPMTLFLASSVNPSGLEVSAAIAMWTGGVVLVAEHLASPPRGLLAALATATAVMVWTRPTALVWPLVGAAVLAPVAWGRVHLVVFRTTVALRCLGALGLAVLGAALWVVLAHAAAVGSNFGPLPGSTSLEHVVVFVVGKMPSLLEQGVGNFGWLDTPAPWFTLAAWGALSAIFVGAAWLLASRRGVYAVLLALVASFVVPVASLTAAAHSYGYVGQGRYFLAIWVSVPVVAAGVVKTAVRPGPVRRLVITAALLVASAQGLAYYWALRRYIVGIPGPLGWSGNTRAAPGPLQWRPPVPGWWLVGIFSILCGIYGVAIARLPRHRPGGGPGPARLLGSSGAVPPWPSSGARR